MDGRHERATKEIQQESERDDIVVVALIVVVIMAGPVTGPRNATTEMSGRR